jgi:hypothetical protein
MSEPRKINERVLFTVTRLVPFDRPLSFSNSIIDHFLFRYDSNAASSSSESGGGGSDTESKKKKQKKEKKKSEKRKSKDVSNSKSSR